MRCHHCDRTVSPAEADDATDAGARVPLCADCLDITVWGGYCGDCDGPIYSSGDAAPRCPVLAVADPSSGESYQDAAELAREQALA